MDNNLEARVERLERFIGNIDQIQAYANSLQQVIDRYLSPLYIETNNPHGSHVLYINDYLGDLNDIPHNIVFKIRASHDLVMPSDVTQDAILRFYRPGTGGNPTEFPLRKMVNGSLVRLNDGNYVNGKIYDVYINSQDVAIITSSEAGQVALDELNSYKATNNQRVSNLEGTVSSNYTTLDNKIDNTSRADKDYTDGKVDAQKTRVDALETKTSAFTKSGNNYTFNGNIVAENGKIRTKRLEVTETVVLTGVAGFVLPSGTTIADPSANLGIANKQWVNTRIKNEIDNYHANFHYVGTSSAESAMQGKENGSFYYKLSQ
jgi:hypothetical protein